MKLREFYNPFQKQITPSAGAILALLFFSHPTLAINCPTPAAQFDKDFRLDLKGKGEVGKLLKLGSGEIDAVLESKVHDLFSKYPNADKLVLQNWTMSMICQQLNESTTLSDQEKLQILFQLHQRVGDIFLKKAQTLSQFGEILKSGTPYERKAAIADALASGDPELQHIALSEIFASSRNFAINSMWHWATGSTSKVSALIIVESFDKLSGKCRNFKHTFHATESRCQEARRLAAAPGWSGWL